MSVYQVCVHSHTVPLSLFGRFCPSLFFTHHFKAGWHNTSSNFWYTHTHTKTLEHRQAVRPIHGTLLSEHIRRHAERSTLTHTNGATGRAAVSSSAHTHTTHTHTHTHTHTPHTTHTHTHTHPHTHTQHTQRLPRTRVSFSPRMSRDDSETQEKQLAVSLRPLLRALRGDRSQSAWCQCCS